MNLSIKNLSLLIAAACLSMAFISHAPSDLQTKAKSENKHIAVYFSGSDWCSICHQFKKKVLDAKEVDSLLNNKYVYHNADFPQRKKLEKELTATNEELAEKLNKEGVFPLLVIVDSDWNIKAKFRGTAKTEEVLVALKRY